jgi:hypothetical protein
MVLAGYFDDSRHEQGSIYCVGGYLGEKEVLDRKLEPPWRDAINSAPYKISEFKTSDCRQRQGEFTDERGWTANQRNDLVIKLVDILCDHIPKNNIIGYSTVVLMPPNFQRLFQEFGNLLPYTETDMRRSFESIAYGFCFVDILRFSYEDIASHSGFYTRELRTVFDSQNAFAFAMKAYDHIIRNYPQLIISKTFRRPVPEDSKNLCALQAADLLAYETGKEVRSRIYEPERPVSKALQRLVNAKPHIATCYTLEQVMKTLDLGKLDGGIANNIDNHPELKPQILFRSGEEWRNDNQWHP